MKNLTLKLFVILFVGVTSCQNSYLQSVKFYLSQREWEKARTVLQKLVEKEPGNGELHFYLGNVAAHLDEYKTMHAEFRACNQVTNKFEYKINYLIQKSRMENYNAGILLQEQKQFEEAIRKFTFVTMIDSTFSKAYVQIAHIYLEKNEFDKAIFFYQQAIAFNKKDVVARNNLAWIYFQRKDWLATINVCQEILKINKKHYDTILRLAYCYDLLNDFENAIKCYEQATKIKPDEKKLYVNLGTNYFKLNQFNEAIARFQEALKFDSTSTKILDYLGESYRETHNYEEMIACYDHLVGLDSTNSNAWKNLISAYSILGQKDQAQTTLAKMERTLKRKGESSKNRSL